MSHLVLLPEEPLFDRQESGFPDGPGAVERGGRSRRLDLVGRGPVALQLFLVGDGRRQRHPIVVGDLWPML